MKEALEGEMRFFPADAKAAVVLEPGDGAFDSPASFVTSQGPTVLGLRAIESIGRDHLDSLSGQELVEPVTIVSFVTNDSRGSSLRNHETEELLDKMAFGGVGGRAARGHGQSLGVNQDHDLDAFAHPSATDAIAATLGFGKSAIDKAFVEAKPAGVFHTASGSLHQGLKDTGLHPRKKPPVNGTLWSKMRRKVFPLRSVIEHPKNPRNDLSLIGRGSSSLRTALRVRNLFRKPIQLFFAKHQHSNNLAFTMPKSRFLDSF
jgi:hypothetical protein